MTLKLLATLVLALTIAACGGKAERQAKYIERGKALFAQGDLVNAQLEFRNALQINPKNVEARYYQGLIAEREGNWQAAFGNFSAVVEEDPNHAQAHRKLAEIYLLGGDEEKAEAETAKLEALTGTTADVLAIRAGIALRKVRSDEARRLAEAALAKEPAHLGATMALASALSNQGYVDEALAVADRALQERADETGLRLLRIKINLDNDRFDGAVAAYRQLIAAVPGAIEHRIGLARLLASRDRLDEAQAVLRQAAADGVGGAQPRLALVDLLAQRYSVAEAETELKALIADAPAEYSYQFKRVDLLTKLGRTDEAKAALAAIIERDGTGASGLEARVQLARLAMAAGNADEVKALITEVLDKDPGQGDALLLRGVLALDAGETDAALADARTVLRGAPRSAAAMRLLAQTQLRRNETDAAMETMVQAIGLDANDVVTREQLAGLHSRRGNLEQALDLYNAVLAIDARRPQSLMPKTEVLIALKRWDDADAAIRTILALPDQQPAGFLLSGRRHQARGEVEPAVGAFKQALALRPGAIEPATGIVQTYLAAQRPEAALAFLDEAIAARPKDAFLRNLRGEVKARQQRIDDAMADYRAAIVEQPDWLVPYTNLGGVLVASGRAAEAVAVYQEALVKRPGNLPMLFSLGVAQEQAADYREAIATFEQILALDPGSDVAANNYAALVADFAYEDPAKLARALEMARRFETANEGSLLDTLGWVLYRTGDYAQARIYLDRAARVRGDAPVVQYHLGMALYRLGDHAAARRALELAVAGNDSYPGKAEAKATLARLSQS